MRTAIVGDVHGCLEELDELLALLALGPDDRLVFVGDLLDRGPEPVGCVRRARELGALAVMGNHEEKHLRFARHEARRAREPGYVNPMQGFDVATRAAHAALTDDDLAWLRGLPPTLRLDARTLVVHGGLEPSRPLDAQRERIVLRLRYVDGRGRVAMGPDPAVPPPGAAPWASRWRGPDSVIYGHAVHDLAAPRIDRRADGVTCWGLDTGCCFGGHLTALVLPTRELVQVRARRAYASLLGGDVE